MAMMMNCFCGMVDRQKVFSLISSRDHCERSSPSQISDTLRAGFEPAQKLSSALVEWSCAVVIINSTHGIVVKNFNMFLYFCYVAYVSWASVESELTWTLRRFMFETNLESEIYLIVNLDWSNDWVTIIELIGCGLEPIHSHWLIYLLIH